MAVRNICTSVQAILQQDCVIKLDDILTIKSEFT